MSYSVDLDELDRVIADLTAFEKKIEGGLRELDTEMRGLAEVWHGSASHAQQLAHQRWTEGAKQMRQALADIRDAARRAHENYTAAGQANARMWRQVR